MWHLPGLPQIYSSVFTLLQHIYLEKICANPFYRPAIDPSSSHINERERAKTLLALRDWEETILFVPSSFPGLHDD